MHLGSVKNSFTFVFPVAKFKNEKMKKIHFVLFAIIIMSIAMGIVIYPSIVLSQKKISQKSYSIPNNVAEVLNNSCVSCHGDGGKGMAMSMWNFSVWDTYSAKKQAKKANAMCNAITKGSMPPASVQKATPEKIPTKAQIDIVCKWANSLNSK